MFGLSNRHRLSADVKDEFEKFMGTLRGFLAKEHAEDGTHTIGRWQAYPVRFTTSGTSPSLGNGRIDGRYTRIGDTVHFVIRMRIGSTTSVGTGIFQFSLPVPMPLRDTPMHVGSAYTLNGVGIVQVQRTGIFIADGTSTFDDTYPGAWTAGMQLFLSGTYEAE